MFARRKKLRMTEILKLVVQSKLKKENVEYILEAV